MISKEAFKLIVAGISLKTGLNQEELALGMGYGKNYISDILSPTGKLTDKFITAFQAQYGSENTNNDPPKELPWQIIDRLSKGIENITEANLLLARKISSGEPAGAFSSSPAKDIVSKDPVEEMQPDKQGKSSTDKQKKRKGSVPDLNR